MSYEIDWLGSNRFISLKGWKYFVTIYAKNALCKSTRVHLTAVTPAIIATFLLKTCATRETLNSCIRQTWILERYTPWKIDYLTSSFSWLVTERCIIIIYKMRSVHLTEAAAEAGNVNTGLLVAQLVKLSTTCRCLFCSKISRILKSFLFSANHHKNLGQSCFLKTSISIVFLNVKLLRSRR